MNSNTNKQRKTLQEQHDEYLIDLDPTTTDAKIGHTKAPFPDENEITDTSDELVAQKSFIPDEAKQYSKIKQNDNLLINKQFEDQEKKYTNPDYENKEILNISEGKQKDSDNLLSSEQIADLIRDIKIAINSLFSTHKIMTRLSIKSHHKYSLEELKDILEHITSIEDRMLDDLESNFDNNLEQAIKSSLEEEFKSKAQAKYFYAQSNKPGKTGKKWKKMADEFSSKTDFNKLPATKKESIDNNNLNNLLERLLK